MQSIERSSAIHEGNHGEDAALFRPILRSGPGFYLVAAGLLAVALFGLYGYTQQLRYGLGVTGLNRPVFWGFYITNFVFFIGISHAGTLISAILRLCKAEWRRPITRMAETITVLVLFFGLGSIIMDLGRPDRALYVLPFFRYGRFQSPLIWDVCSITTYLTASTLYLFLPLIPDIALLRDRVTGWRRTLYRMLALGWTGTPRQHRRLEIAIAIMAVLVIPIAVSVHTVVSWVFAMTVQPMWHSTIFGPYFVVGAIFSGIAALLLAMALIRRVYHLEEYLKPIHFNYLGILLLVMTLLWFYFTFAEYITTYYGSEPDEMAVFWAKISGPYWPFFWAMVLFNFVIPFIVLANRRTRTVAGTVVASTSVVIGMWLERFTIVVPTLVNPRLPWPRGFYVPTWVEVSITASFFALFTLLYMLFTKFFPIISIWEVREGRERGVREVEERIRSYLPSPAAVEDGVGAGSPARSGRRGLWLGLGLAWLCPALLASSVGAAPLFTTFTPLGDPRKGQQLFETKGCIRCHRVDGRGGTAGPDLSRVGEQRHLLQLIGLFWNHSPQMTAKMRELKIPRPVLSGSQMADLMAYLYALNYFDQPGDPVRGAQLFKEKQCIACHTIKGAGGPIGPPAVRLLGGFGSPLLMIQAMWNHGPDMQERMKALGVPRFVFQGADMADILAFLRREGKRDSLPSQTLVPGDPREGWKLFTIKGCIRCHAVQGQGGKVGPDLSRQRPPQTPSGLAGLLWNHGSHMRAQMSRLDVSPPTFTGEEVSDLVAYFYFIGFFDPSSDPTRGHAVFTRKGCVRCHAVKGNGGSVGPDLAGSEAILSPVEAARLMWNHAPFMEARMKKLGISWPLFEGNEMADLLAYLNSLLDAGEDRP